MSKKVLVIGGGIAGPAAAMFFKKIGYEVEVYEARNEQEGDEGLFLNIARNGLNVLDELGIAKQLQNDGIKMHAMEFKNGKGKILGTIGSQDGEAQGYTIKRNDLHRLLIEQAKESGIPIYFEKRLVQINMGDRDVSVHFADGTFAKGDFLIGCDGIHSMTRNLLMPNAEKPSYTGLISFGGYASLDTIPYKQGFQHMVFGKKAFFGYIVKNNGEIYWFGNVNYPGTPTRKELERIPQEQWRNLLETLYRDDIYPVMEIIRATNGKIGVYPIYDMLTQPRWFYKRAIFIGDAIHATSPNAGQGASLALEDAMALAMFVRDIEDLESAFSKFQQFRKERVEKIVQYSRRIGQRKYATNPIQVFFRDLMLPIFLKSSNEKSNRWIYDFHLDWNTKANRLIGKSID